MKASAFDLGANRAVCVAALATAFAGVASAQQAPAGSGEGAIAEEIVVTARRREESLQDVPIAVTALSASQLETLSVRTLEDITALAPNIKVNAGRATSSTINAYIRGVGQNDPLWGFEPGVGIYLDDVFIARPQGALLDVYDVERVEILRGPQGTLYGKNTIAGAIKYVTRDIVGDARMTAALTAGSFNQLDAKLSGSMPVIGDRLYVGAAVAYLTRDGYGELVDDGAPRPFNRVGDDVSDKDVLAARANATLVWGNDSKLKILVDTIQENSNAAGGRRLNDFIQPALRDRYDQRTDMPVDQDRYIAKGASATYTQSLTDALGLKIVAAYREGDGRQFIDFDELNANLFQVPAIYEDDQTSGEAQVSYDSDRVQGVAGLYYYTGQACGAFDASLGALGLTSLTKGCVDTDSIAAYFDTTWRITARLNINAGARWNEDDKEASVFVAQYAGRLPANATLFDPNNVPAGFTRLSVQSDYTNSRTFSDVSPRLGADIRITDGVMAYVSYSQGFKSGGFDMRGNEAAFPGTRNGYDSETADNYELGMKSTLLDGQLLLNAAVFYTPYEDVQVTTQQFQIVNGLPTNVTAVLNAGKQLNKGAELEAVWRPVDALTLTLNAGYLDAQFEEFLTSCGANCVRDISSSNKPINAPDWTAFFGGQYRWDLPRGMLTSHVGYTYRGATKVANTTASITDQEAYDIVDVGLAYVTENNAWRFALDCKNLFDEEYRVAGYDFGNPGVGATGGLSQIGFYGPPRTVALTATFQY